MPREFSETDRQESAEPGSYKPDEFLAFIRRENAKWDMLIRERNIEVERPRLNL